MDGMNELKLRPIATRLLEMRRACAFAKKMFSFTMNPVDLDLYCMMDDTS